MESPTQQMQPQASVETPIEGFTMNGEAREAESSLAVLPVMYELYSFLRWSWLLYTPLRTSSQRLEEIWLPLIVDNAIWMPSESGGVWTRPLGSPIPLLSPPTMDPRTEYDLDLPLEPARCQRIIECLFKNPYVARFFHLILDVELQHEQLAINCALKCVRFLTQSKYDQWRQWVDVCPKIPQKPCVFRLVRGQALARPRLESPRRQHPLNPVSETASPNPDTVLSSVRMPIIKIDTSSNEETCQSAWRNLERLDAEASVALQVIEANGEDIRNELRTNLARRGQVEWSRQEPQPMVTEGSPGRGNAHQDPEPSHMPNVDNVQQSHEPSLEPPRAPDHVSQLPVSPQYQRRGAISQRGSQDIQQSSTQSPNPLHQAPDTEPLDEPVPNPLLQGVPVLRPRGEGRPNTPVGRVVHVVLEFPSLSVCEDVGRQGGSQTTTYGSAIMQLDYRIKNVQALQEELPKVFDCVFRRSGKLIEFTEKRFRSLMLEEYQRMHGYRTNVAPFFTQMHLASLRESTIVVNRAICSKEETLSKMNQLKIWFHSLRSDFILAVRLYGKDTPIKHDWCYPPWSAEMESLPLEMAELWIEMNELPLP